MNTSRALPFVPRGPLLAERPDIAPQCAEPPAAKGTSYKGWPSLVRASSVRASCASCRSCGAACARRAARWAAGARREAAGSGGDAALRARPLGKSSGPRFWPAGAHAHLPVAVRTVAARATARHCTEGRRPRRGPSLRVRYSTAAAGTKVSPRTLPAPLAQPRAAAPARRLGRQSRGPSAGPGAGATFTFPLPSGCPRGPGQPSGAGPHRAAGPSCWYKLGSCPAPLPAGGACLCQWQQHSQPPSAAQDPALRPHPHHAHRKRACLVGER